MTTPPDRIELPGARLRRLTVDDAPAVVHAIEESLEHLRPWMPWAALPETLKVEFQRNRLRENAETFALGKTYEYGLLLPDDTRVIGAFGLMERRGPGTLELGYWVHVDVSGRGHGTNAARALVDVALAVDGVETVIIVCDEANARSAAIPRKLGFTLASVGPRAPQAPAESGREMVWTKVRRDLTLDAGRPRPAVTRDNGPVRFVDVVATSEAVAATRSRTAKIDALAALLAGAEPDEIVPVVGMLTGVARQGRIGIGWATVAGIDVEPASTTSLTVDDIDRVVSEIATTTGAGSAAARRTLLHELFARATDGEADFLKRFLLGELRQGALAGIMTDAIARASDVPLATVRRAAMRSGDLAETARLARTGGGDALAAVELEVLRPILPMLASTADDVAAALEATGLASVEWKLDGARIQVHRAGDDVRVFTRNLNEITDRVPEVVAVARDLECGECVLDGEAMGLADDERPHKFQDTMSRFGRDDGSGHDVTLRPFFFDCLRVDGTDLLDQPLSSRLDALGRVAPHCRVPAIVTGDPVVAQGFLDDALRAGHEGVMCKAIASPYEAGRRGAAWRKVKPVRTLDLVVLAAEWGSGRRRGWLSNLHLGARDPDGQFGPAGELVMVGKTFKGLTDELLRWQTDEFQTRVAREDGHVVFVRPELVVEIALDGAQASTRYPGGVALRFARVRGYRPDKSPADADTITAVRDLL